MYHTLPHNFILQVNEKIQGHIGIVEKAKETSSDSGMHNRVITVLYT